jgi:hypothetical protein
MTALIDAVVAVTPLAFIAIVALPVACIRKRFTDVAKHSNFLPFLRVVLAHERMRRR